MVAAAVFDGDISALQKNAVRIWSNLLHCLSFLSGAGLGSRTPEL